MLMAEIWSSNLLAYPLCSFELVLSILMKKISLLSSASRCMLHLAGQSLVAGAKTLRSHSLLFVEFWGY